MFIFKVEGILPPTQHCYKGGFFHYSTVLLCHKVF